MSGKRILIIDDEETIQKVVQFGINLVAGWEVLTAGSGAEGVEMAQIERPDAILLDVVMSGMDGIATFQKLQAGRETQHIPVILLTASSDPAAIQQFHQLGVRGVIIKPFNSLHLPEQIARILHWS